MKSTEANEKMTHKQRFAALFRVGKISFRAAPSILYTKIISSLINSLLPITTTFFAAQTTTELARAYNGEAGAGDSAIFFVIVTALLGVISLTWFTIESYITRMARYKLEAAVNDQLIAQFLSLDFWRYDEKDTADLLDKSRKFSNFFVNMFDALGRILTSLITLVTSIVALWFVSGWLALLVFVAVVPGLYVQYKTSKARAAHWTENVETRRRYWNIEWQLTNIRPVAEIRLYGLVQHLTGLFRIYRDKDQKDQILIERRYAKLDIISGFIEAAAEVIALIYVTLQIIAHMLPVGQFLFVQQIVSRALGAVRDVASAFITIDEDLANLSAYDSFMNLPTQKPGGIRVAKVPKQIEFDHVSFSYPNNKTKVLSDISFVMNHGERIAIVGENGAGKTTIVKLLLGFYQPTKGIVKIDGVSTAELDLAQWHARIGVLQQSSIDYDYAVARDNIVFGDVSRPFSRQRYSQAVEHAEAKEFLDKLPKKDETYINQWMEHADGTPGVSLSGGQWQRLALARNFYRDSPVVILDEPTSAIDALAESRIFRWLFSRKDKTIITISHRLSTVRRADRIYVVEHGKVVEQGTHAELVKAKGQYFALFESQL
ncbi:MAG: ABC transporter ATP-binding protein [Candidatus Microsaccharimonas sp.]